MVARGRACADVAACGPQVWRGSLPWTASQRRRAHCGWPLCWDCRPPRSLPPRMWCVPCTHVVYSVMDAKCQQLGAWCCHLGQQYLPMHLRSDGLMRVQRPMCRARVCLIHHTSCRIPQRWRQRRTATAGSPAARQSGRRPAAPGIQRRRTTTRCAPGPSRAVYGDQGRCLALCRSSKS